MVGGSWGCPVLKGVLEGHGYGFMRVNWPLEGPKVEGCIG